MTKEELAKIAEEKKKNQDMKREHARILFEQKEKAKKMEFHKLQMERMEKERRHEERLENERRMRELKA